MLKKIFRRCFSSSSSSFPYDLNDFTLKRIRNFSVIAHVDHGKSTLSTKMLELTGTLKAPASAPGDTGTLSNYLDKLKVEKERGITVKAQSCSMVWRSGGADYLLNLIDTPGHVDFSAEVRKALRACDAAVLVVDACEGVQAQTLSNLYLAFDAGLAIIPVVNKIDLPNAQPLRRVRELCEGFGFHESEVVLASGKTGEGVARMLERIVAAPAPAGADGPLRALVFDSHFDRHRGVVAHVRVFDGELKKGDELLAHAGGRRHVVEACGVLHPEMCPTPSLPRGCVGWVVAGLKRAGEARLGDTWTHFEASRRAPPLPGFEPAAPVVFAGLYPAEGADFDALRDALEKLALTDASVELTPEFSQALGAGFRAGFLGLLHMEVLLQRLEDEFGVGAVCTAPTVPYRLVRSRNRGDEEDYEVLDCPTKFPDDAGSGTARRHGGAYLAEPMCKARIIVPKAQMQPVLRLCRERRGEQQDLVYLDDVRAMITMRFPLAEIMSDFFDHLKRISSGYATLDYEPDGYQEADLVKLQVLLHGEPADALSIITHRSKAEPWGRSLVRKLKELIPRHQFPVAIQACVGAKVVARETVPALRKDVTAKCYGGDITRKRKLLEKQKQGKAKMRKIGRIDVPQEAFYSVLKR